MRIKKNQFVKFDVVFLKSLRIANVSKLGLYLILYIREKTSILENKGYLSAGIDYNDDKINKECFNTGPTGKQTTRALEHLASKNIVFYNPESRKIRINHDPKTWYLTDDQHEKIMKILSIY